MSDIDLKNKLKKRKNIIQFFKIIIFWSAEDLHACYCSLVRINTLDLMYIKSHTLGF